MTEWEAKYKALLAGIRDEDYVRNAEALVETALNLSVASPVTFEQTVRAMLSVASLQQPPPRFVLPLWLRLWLELRFGRIVSTAVFVLGFIAGVTVGALWS